MALHVGIGRPSTPPPTATPSPVPSPRLARSPRPPQHMDVLLAPVVTSTPSATATPTATASPSHTSSPTATATAVAPLTITLTCRAPELQMALPPAPLPACDGPLAAGVLALTVLAAGERLRAALRRQQSSQVALGLQQLALQRAALGRTISVSPDELLDVVNQIVFDVLGEPAGIDELVEIQTDPPLAVIFTRAGRRFFAFTPQPDRARALHPDGHWFVVDALTAHPFVTEELAALYTTAMSLYKPMDRALQPRAQRWGLVVWDGPRAAGRGSLRTRLRSLLPWSRWWLRRAREVSR